MKSRKIIKIIGGLLITLLVLFLLIIVLGNFAVNRYLNADGRKDLTKYLPINGTATYERATVKLFRSFPDVTVQLEGLKLGDSLAAEHGYPPLALEKLNVRASIIDLRNKQFVIEGVDLEGLTVNLYDDKNGYSNIANLIKKKIDKQKTDNKEAGVSVDYDNLDLNISNVAFNKIDKRIGQQAHVLIDAIHVDNQLVNNQHRLGLEMKKLFVADDVKKLNDEVPIQLDQLLVNVTLDESFSKLGVQNIQLNNGHIHLINDSLGQSNYQKLFGNKEKVSVNQSGNKSGMAIDINKAKIDIGDIDFAMIDQPKHKHLEARIVKLETELQADQDTSAVVAIELDIDQLGFNTRKGAYLSESIVKGQIQVDVSSKLIALSSQPLLINEEDFDVKANIYTDKKTPTTLTIEKGDVQTSIVKPLLTQGIRKSIAAYDVIGPFYTKASVYFTPGKKDPRVEVDLRVNNKTVKAKGQTIKKANLSATFINRLHDDARQFSENKRNVRFMIHEVSGVFNDFQIESQNALITSTPQGGDRLIAKANITGQAASVSKYLNHDKFNFQEGNFTLSTDINGSLNNFDDLISGTNMNLAMDDLEVHYPEGNTVFPFKLLELNKQDEKTLFHIQGFNEYDKRAFHIRGEVDRVESLFFPERAGRLRTEASIRANSVSWQGLVALFGKDGIFSNTKRIKETEAKRSMKQTLAGIEQSFHPVVSIAIDTVFYGKDIQLLSFSTGIKFDDARTLVLDETTFKIDKSNVTLDGEVKINQLDFTRFDFDVELNHLDFDALMPKFDYFGVHLIKQIKDHPDNLTIKMKLSGELDDNEGLKPESIQADISYESFAEDKFTGHIRLKANPETKKVDVVFGHSGHPRSFNHILENDAYRFDKGWYTISFHFDDNFETMAQMVEESTFNLTIDDAEVYMTELDFTVPLTRIEVASLKNKAFYHILLQSDSLNQEVAFDGTVNNIRHFAFKDTEDPYEVTLDISSPRIVWNDLLALFALQKQDTTQGRKTLKESITKVLKDFNPSVKLMVDTLEYSDQIRFNDIFAHAYLDGEMLKIDSATVAYGNSRIQANIDADMSNKAVLPFHMDLELTNIDIGQTLAHFDYFNVPELREAKQIEGHVWFYLNMNAEMNLVDNGFNIDKTEAYIAVEMKDVVVEDFQTIDTISIGMGFDSRLEVLRFAPIQSKIKIKGQRIEVTQTEIQSNAIHAFVEGAIDKKSPESLWISVPLANLKKPDLETIPERTGYEGAGRKIYLQLISSQDEDDGKMKVNLKKKKYFQERFKARQFRAYKRVNRRARRLLRRDARKAK